MYCSELPSNVLVLSSEIWDYILLCEQGGLYVTRCRDELGEPILTTVLNLIAKEQQGKSGEGTMKAEDQGTQDYETKLLEANKGKEWNFF